MFHGFVQIFLGFQWHQELEGIKQTPEDGNVTLLGKQKEVDSHREQPGNLGMREEPKEVMENGAPVPSSLLSSNIFFQDLIYQGTDAKKKSQQTTSARRKLKGHTSSPVWEKERAGMKPWACCLLLWGCSDSAAGPAATQHQNSPTHSCWVDGLILILQQDLLLPSPKTAPHVLAGLMVMQRCSKTPVSCTQKFNLADALCPSPVLQPVFLHTDTAP